MKFKKIGANEAESNEGFIVRRNSRCELEYIEAGKSIFIEVEPGEGLAVYISSLNIDAKEKERIAKNISSALKFLNIDYLLA